MFKNSHESVQRKWKTEFTHCNVSSEFCNARQNLTFSDLWKTKEKIFPSK